MRNTFQNFAIPEYNYQKPISLPKKDTRQEKKNTNTTAKRSLSIKQQSVAYVVSTAAAWASYYAVKYFFKKSVFPPLTEHFTETSKLSTEETKNCKDAAEKILKTPEFSTTGTKIKYLSESYYNRDELRRNIIRIGKMPFNLHKVKFIRKYILQKRAKMYESMANGTNSCYINATRCIWINEKKLMGTIFHELGHAKSHQNPNKFLNSIEFLYNRKKYYLLAAALLIPKARKESPTKTDKIRNTLINSIPILALMGFAPTLIEEAKASKYGIEFAKQYTTPELLKKITKSYKKAYLTYIAGAISGVSALVAAIYTRNKVNTKIIENYKNKNSD